MSSTFAACEITCIIVKLCTWLKNGNCGFYFALDYADDHTSIYKHAEEIAKYTQPACNLYYFMHEGSPLRAFNCKQFLFSFEALSDHCFVVFIKQSIYGFLK